MNITDTGTYLKDKPQMNDMLQSVYAYFQESFGFKKPPSLFLVDDGKNGDDVLGKTGQYNPSTYEIHIYVSGRHPKDILRSLAHELYHHVQNCNGGIPKNSNTNEGYAQVDSDLRKVEEEAYQKGNITFRDWEDKMKKGNKMKKIKEELDPRYVMKDEGVTSEQTNEVDDDEENKNKREALEEEPDEEEKLDENKDSNKDWYYGELNKRLTEKWAK